VFIVDSKIVKGDYAPSLPSCSHCPLWSTSGWCFGADYRHLAICHKKISVRYSYLLAFSTFYLLL